MTTNTTRKTLTKSKPRTRVLALGTGLAIDDIIARVTTLEISGGHEESFAIRRLADVVADLARIVKQQ